MLGNNDFQSMHDFNAWHSSQGIATLINTIRTAAIEPGMSVPPILVVSPPPILSPKGTIAPKFIGAVEKCIGVSSAYEAVCELLDCHFYDAGSVVTTSEIDGIHLDYPQHLLLGNILAKVVIPYLS